MGTTDTEGVHRGLYFERQQALTAVMEAQVINYLRLSGVPVGYLINFRNTRVEWKRFVHQRE